MSSSYSSKMRYNLLKMLFIQGSSKYKGNGHMQNLWPLKGVIKSLHGIHCILTPMNRFITINVFMILHVSCIRETPERVLLQTVKIQMKCNIILHFIKVYTDCKGKKDHQTI